jgi:hypothetical protein
MYVLFDKFYSLLKGPFEEEPRAELVEDPKRMALNRAIVSEMGRMNREGSVTSIIVVRDGLPETFIEFAEANGVPVFDPQPVLGRLAESGVDPKYWPGSQRSGHWNQYAHVVISEFLTDKISPLIN